MEHQDLSFVEMTNCKLAMKDALMARACGHDHLNKFCIDDLATFDREMAHLTGIAYAGVSLD
jgi:predicted nucleic acid-binding protein